MFALERECGKLRPTTLCLFLSLSFCFYLPHNELSGTQSRSGKSGFGLCCLFLLTYFAESSRCLDASSRAVHPVPAVQRYPLAKCSSSSSNGFSGHPHPCFILNKTSIECPPVRKMPLGGRRMTFALTGRDK